MAQYLESLQAAAPRENEKVEKQMRALAEGQAKLQSAIDEIQKRTAKLYLMKKAKAQSQVQKKEQPAAQPAAAKQASSGVDMRALVKSLLQGK